MLFLFVLLLFFGGGFCVLVWCVLLVVVGSTLASLLVRGLLTMVPVSAFTMIATIVTMSAAMDKKNNSSVASGENFFQHSLIFRYGHFCDVTLFTWLYVPLFSLSPLSPVQGTPLSPLSPSRVHIQRPSLAYRMHHQVCLCDQMQRSPVIASTWLFPFPVGLLLFHRVFLLASPPLLGTGAIALPSLLLHVFVDSFAVHLQKTLWCDGR